MPIDTKYGRVTLERQRNIADDEPVVVFRAQDELLPDLLDTYRQMCKTAGSPRNHLDGITLAQRRVLEWQQVHGFKTPDSVGFDPDSVDAR
jgi:hypothetical protein